MKKKLNKDLTAEQKLVLFEDGTEAPGTSELNNSFNDIKSNFFESKFFFLLNLNTNSL